MEMAKFKYSAQVFGYVPKPLKKRMVVLRGIDPKRFSESRVIEDALSQYVPQLEEKVLPFNVPTQGAPGRKRSAA
jgi:hypothetical protein